MKLNHFHIIPILILGSSASLWSILETRFLMPLLWMGFLSLFIFWTNRNEWRKLVRRILHVGFMLILVSLLQVVFRREGSVFLSIGRLPLVYSGAVREAVLIWIRYMILFMSAALFLQKPSFEIVTFLNRIGFSMRFCLLMLAAFRMIPSIFMEAKRVLFFLRFRGIRIRTLPFTQKIRAFRQFAYALLMQSMETVFATGYGIAGRGFRSTGAGRLPVDTPMRARDYMLITCSLMLSAGGLWMRSLLTGT